MEVKYHYVFILAPILIIIYLFFPQKKKRIKKESFKIANTIFVKNTTYFKKIFKNYQNYKTLLYISFIFAIISAILLVSRIQITETHNLNEYKRDIMLCMDVSGSVDQLNIEIIENLKTTVNSLKGERFGISMFNTTSVLVAPLTDDYEYIIKSLDEIEKSIKANNGRYYITHYDDDYYYIKNYIYTGTIEGHEERGSSLIGDGLASCVYSFPKIEEDRSRFIIFTTDNVLEGTPIVTFDKAAEISKKRNIPVYGIGTKKMTNENIIEMKRAITKTGGTFYQHSNQAVNGIVKDIEKSSKSLTNSKIETKETDQPTLPFIMLVLSFGAVILFSKKVIVWEHSLLSLQPIWLLSVLY